MELTVTHYEGYVLAKIAGALDENARPQFREELHPLVGKAGMRLILDLSGVPRVNSAGIGNLVALVADANTQHSRVIMCGLTPFAAGVMSVTKLDSYFEISPDVEAAIAKA
ncbi:MAG: STAS domain-containing protein [Planctomycetaceae bacterium]|nr:STAS domain-containing protein [Planctomycetaceae bacterium]